jgi:hypothetical protein
MDRKRSKEFSERLEKVLQQILITPGINKYSLRRPGLRECQITKHNTLFYNYDEDHLYIVTIFDNRQDPAKNKA